MGSWVFLLQGGESHTCQVCICSDWIEHVLETGGVPYLRTPAHQLNIFVRNSLDTYGFLLGCSGALMYLVWQIVHEAAFGRSLLTGKPKLA